MKTITVAVWSKFVSFFRSVARASIILESQAPGGAEKIRELEDMLNYKPQANYDEAPRQAPVFTQQLRGPPGKIKEGQSVHLEASLQPVGDPSMKIEWFFNGRCVITLLFPSCHRWVWCMNTLILLVDH